MALSREIYKAFEAIVGEENISDEPATLETYAFQQWAELRKEASPWMPRAAAVILPGSTEEVQAIVKTCNRYHLKYKAYSTGWGLHAAPFYEGAIQIDLRRMDRIIELDEKNQFAVIEPYVIGATLQAEAMKVGLNTHIVGAGAGVSPLAGATSFVGIGPDSLFMGMSNENLLGAEWVMPNGEILRLGSLSSTGSWFCGDGPGPSLSGVFRGPIGAAGGLGVFTKCALKLYPWPGPAIMPVEGKIPVYTSKLPDVIQTHTIAWGSWEGFRDALHLIFDNDIGYIAHRQFIMFGNALQGATLRIITDPDKTIDDMEEYLANPECQKLSEELHRSFQIILAGMTERDIEYQEKVLDTILEKTGGWKVAAMEEPTMSEFTALYLIKLCFKGLNWVYRGAFADHLIRAGTPEVVTSGFMEQMQAQQDAFAKKTGLITDHGGDAGMGGMGGLGGGGYPGFENFALYDPADRESAKAARQIGDEGGYKAATVVSGGYSIFCMSEEEVKKGLKHVSNPLIWRYQRKIKEALDPNGVGGGSWYYLEEPDIEDSIKSYELMKAKKAKEE